MLFLCELELIPIITSKLLNTADNIALFNVPNRILSIRFIPQNYFYDSF